MGLGMATMCANRTVSARVEPRKAQVEESLMQKEMRQMSDSMNSRVDGDGTYQMFTNLR